MAAQIPRSDRTRPSHAARGTPGHSRSPPGRSRSRPRSVSAFDGSRHRRPQLSGRGPLLALKLEEGSLEIDSGPIDVTEVADETIEVLAPVASAADVRLELSADNVRSRSAGPRPSVVCLRNLLDNAIRFAPAGSSGRRRGPGRRRRRRARARRRTRISTLRSSTKRSIDSRGTIRRGNVRREGPASVLRSPAVSSRPLVDRSGRYPGPGGCVAFHLPGPDGPRSEVASHLRSRRRVPVTK